MQALGLDFKILIAQIINFGILYFVLSKLLFKPLIKVLDERKKKAEELADNSKQMEERLIKLEEKERNVLKEARTKAGGEREDLLKLAQNEKEQIIEEAKSAADREAEKGVEKIKTAEAEARKRLKKDISDKLINEVTKKLSPSNSRSKLPMLKDLLK
jgi:F-type H+-transporting ATPase subunit b